MPFKSHPSLAVLLRRAGQLLPAARRRRGSTVVGAIGRDDVERDNGCQFAAWFGVVPRQHASGGKPTVLGMSKRGDACLRTMLIHAQARQPHLARGPGEDGREVLGRAVPVVGGARPGRASMPIKQAGGWRRRRGLLRWETPGFAGGWLLRDRCARQCMAESGIGIVAGSGGVYWGAGPARTIGERAGALPQAARCGSQLRIRCPCRRAFAM